MIFIDYELPEFKEFCEHSLTLWREHPLPERAPYIVVELLHNNATLLYVNLLIGRHLARQNNWRIVGFVSDTFCGMPTSKDRVKRFARSFGVTEFYDLDSNALPDRFRELLSFSSKTQCAQLLKRLSKLLGAGLRRTVLETSIGHVAIGDLLYDSYLQRYSTSSIDCYDERLEKLVMLAFNLFRRSNALLHSFDVAASKTSHTTYLKYGLLMRMVLKNGGVAFGSAATVDAIRLRHYRSLQEAPRSVAEIEPKIIEFFRRECGDRLRILSDRFYPPTQGSSTNLAYLRYGYGKDKQHLGRSEMISALGLLTENKSVAIMAHMFADAPHYTVCLFDDYGNWLDETLNHASGITNINWVVRQHPYERLVGQTAEFDRIVGKYPKIYSWSLRSFRPRPFMR